MLWARESGDRECAAGVLVVSMLVTDGLAAGGAWCFRSLRTCGLLLSPPAGLALQEGFARACACLRADSLAPQLFLCCSCRDSVVLRRLYAVCLLLLLPLLLLLSVADADANADAAQRTVAVSLMMMLLLL